MLKIKQYVKAESLEQAYELNQKKTNRIVGGMLWLKMSTAQIQTAIDLSGLGLDQIEETEDAWKIGCMVSLRDLELHEGLNELSCNMIRESVSTTYITHLRQSQLPIFLVFLRRRSRQVLLPSTEQTVVLNTKVKSAE